jgi:hypothetical protein
LAPPFFALEYVITRALETAHGLVNAPKEQSLGSPGYFHVCRRLQNALARKPAIVDAQNATVLPGWLSLDHS